MANYRLNSAFLPDNPNRVADPEDDFNEDNWVQLCCECSKPLYRGDRVFEFDTNLPFGTVCYCEDCIKDFEKIL